MVRRGYIGPAGQQTHYIDNCGSGASSPLICLHGTAYSARSFDGLLEAMAPGRRVLALDTPGYGGSDKPSDLPTLEGYAESVGRAIDELGESRVDLFGYHTGALIAAELARQRPELVRRLVLIGVPCFAGEEREAWRTRLAERTTLNETLKQFEPRWWYLVTNRPAGVRLDRAFAHFVDELRSYPDSWWAHDAAFTYDSEDLLPEVKQATLIMNPDTPLSEGSRRAAGLLPNALLAEMPHLGHSVLDLASVELAARTEAFLRDD